MADAGSPRFVPRLCPPPHPFSIIPSHCRLDRIGYEVGVRNMELLSYREKLPRRKPEILDALRWVGSSC